MRKIKPEDISQASWTDKENDRKVYHSKEHGETYGKDENK
jgi:hypothetical protein